ncbi:MAG TPA: hypothetical protein VHO27_16205 [Angustibacter sp.]|nr:hypothetical protein [Angustibacter sp.]
MTDEPERPAPDATPTLSRGTTDPLAVPPSGAGAEPSLAARRPGSTSLPVSTLVMLGVALLVVGGVIGALVGHSIGGSPSQQVSAARAARGGAGFQGGFGNRQGGGQGQPGAAGQGGGFTAGTVTKVDGNTLSVKQQDGTTVVVKVDASTAVTVTKQGSSSDVAVGESVVAMGQAGSDGSVTARTLRVGDQVGFGRGRPTNSGG